MKMIRCSVVCGYPWLIYRVLEGHFHLHNFHEFESNYWYRVFKKVIVCLSMKKYYCPNQEAFQKHLICGHLVRFYEVGQAENFQPYPLLYLLLQINNIYRDIVFTCLLSNSSRSRTFFFVSVIFFHSKAR